MLNLADEYCKWLVAAEDHLDQFEKNVFKIDYIENIKAHILEGHRYYKICKAIPTCEESKVCKFRKMWTKLHDVFELAYRCEIKGACLEAMEDIEDDKERGF